VRKTVSSSKSHKIVQTLTSFEGDTDGALLGLFEGDWLGVDVGCKVNDLCN